MHRSFSMIRYFCMGKGDEIDAVRWRTLGTYFKSISNYCVETALFLIQIPFYWRTLHLPEKKDFCADFGTGCGTIPLIWSSRYMPRHIYAVELQDNACSMVQRTLQKIT